jgi:hypothetical protein
LNELAREPFDETRTYGDVVHFLHVYIIEPHPLGPDPSPYGGEVRELVYSTIQQPCTYEERLQAAADLEAMIEGDQILVVDELDPACHVNPIWCTYGPTANGAFLIRQDGIIDVAQVWLDPDAMREAIRELLAK